MNNSLFDVLRDGFQCLTIPRSGRYKFEVIGVSSREDEPGARIIGEVRLKEGDKITVALGQTGSNYSCGNGGTFVVKENGTSNPHPLFVAGGAGSAGYSFDYGFSKASLCHTASGNVKIGSSGVQKFIRGDINGIYCGGAGFLEGPKTRRLRENSVAPKSYKDGLIGGKGIDYLEFYREGGFGGGGAIYCSKHYGRYNRRYLGAGGGYTGGGTKIYDGMLCDGGGGGSYSIDEKAQFDHVHEQYGKCTVTYLDYK